MKLPVVAVMLGLATTAAAAPCEDAPRMATEFGVTKSWHENLTARPEPFRVSESANVRHLRLLMVPVHGPGVQWTVTIRDLDERPLASLSSDNHTSGVPFWTDRLATNAVSLFVSSTPPDAGPVLRTREYVAMLKQATRPYYSTQTDVPAWKSLYDDTVPSFLKRRGDSIGMFVAHSGNTLSGFRAWTCTGFVVASAPEVLFVTNDHCGGPWDAADRWGASVCENALIDFSWDDDQTSREYTCVGKLRDEANDIAVLRLKPVRPDAPPPPLRLRAAPLAEEEVSVIHHPAAMTKRLSDRCPALTTAATTSGTLDLTRDFGHRCDTEGGSSGAPVLDTSGRVVGVHHLGFEKNAAGRCDMLNKAAHVGKLIELLRNSPGLTGYIIDLSIGAQKCPPIGVQS